MQRLAGMAGPRAAILNSLADSGEAVLFVFRALLLLAALISPASAENRPAIEAGIKDAANQLPLYLAFAAKPGRRADFSTPPVSDLFATVFDLKQLAALPPPQATDLPWLM